MSFRTVDVIKELNKLERMSNHEFTELRNKKFRECVRRQYNTDPFLRKLYNSKGIYEYNLPRTLEQIDKLPVINRDFLTEANYHKNLIISGNEVRKIVHTYGSIGKPTWLVYSHSAAETLSARLFIRTMYFTGADPFKPSYWITHYTLEQDEWASHLMAVESIRHLGGNHIDESTATPLPVHLEKISKTKPYTVVSAPNFFLALAAVNKQNVTFPHAIAGGQRFDEEIRKFIEESFKTEMHGFYPSSENGVIASECKEKQGYHLWLDSHEVEILDENNERVGEGEKGKVVITTYDMDGSSIIRYEIGDEAMLVGACSCGSRFPIIKDIRRRGFASFGDAKVSYGYLEDIDRKLRVNYPVTAFQVSKVRQKDKRERPVIKVEVKSLSKDLADEIREKAKELFLMDSQIRNEMGKTIHDPIVKLFAFGNLTKGRFKLPIYEENH